MLTTASITRSATSEMPSGPRAKADCDAGNRIAVAARAARAARRAETASSVMTPDMGLISPRGLGGPSAVRNGLRRNRGSGSRRRNRPAVATQRSSFRASLAAFRRPERRQNEQSCVKHVQRQPRIAQTMTRPSTALARPTTRSIVSGVSSTAVTARLAECGDAAKTSPSMTKTSPIATRKSDMEAKPELRPRGRSTLRRWRWRLRRRRAGRGRRGRPAELALGIQEVSEELRVGLDDEPGIALLEARLIGLHRAVEGEEIRVLAERVGEDAVALGVALAAQLLALRRRLGHDDGRVAV